MYAYPEPEYGLADADRRIAEAERNIRHVGALVPQLAREGYATAEVECQLELMTEVLIYLKEQRHVIAETLYRQ